MANSISRDSISSQRPPLFKYTSHASLTAFNVPYKTYINDLAQTLPTGTLTYRHIAVGALVFSQPRPLKCSKPSSEPRILLLRRSPTDSMPLKWEREYTPKPVPD